MNAQARLLILQRNACLLARQLTELQLLCHSATYSQRLPELVASVLRPCADKLDELEVMSATTPLNEPIEQANRYNAALLALLAAVGPCTLTAAEVATMVSPVIRLLTKAERMVTEVTQ